ncbi:hypothetical protein H9L39_19677 [Fusarium oxysporum f. sp. albedinis]|nr:hypothetical protein H9L39_19677 [Fusarium oxysporum f. sp. albedinis]
MHSAQRDRLRLHQSQQRRSGDCEYGSSAGIGAQDVAEEAEEKQLQVEEVATNRLEIGYAALPHLRVVLWQAVTIRLRIKRLD